jgi:hypothetical protein
VNRGAAEDAVETRGIESAEKTKVDDIFEIVAGGVDQVFLIDFI